MGTGKAIIQDLKDGQSIAIGNLPMRGSRKPEKDMVDQLLL